MPSNRSESDSIALYLLTTSHQCVASSLQPPEFCPWEIFRWQKSNFQTNFSITIKFPFFHVLLVSNFHLLQYQGLTRSNFDVSNKSGLSVTCNSKVWLRHENVTLFPPSSFTHWLLERITNRPFFARTLLLHKCHATWHFALSWSSYHSSLLEKSMLVLKLHSPESENQDMAGKD